MASFSWTEPIVAPPDVVWEVVTNHRGYSDFTPIRRVELEREGSPDPNGLGAIRKLHAVGPPIREEIIEFVPQERFAYKALSGVPAKNHIGTVTLEPAPGGTRMRYDLETEPRIPGSGPVFKIAIGQLVKSIVGESEKRAAAKKS